MRKMRYVLVVAVVVAAILAATGIVLAEQSAAPRHPVGKTAMSGRAGAAPDPRAQHQSVQTQQKAIKAARESASRSRGAGALSTEWSYAPGRGARASAITPGAGQVAALSMEMAPVDAPSKGSSAQIVSSPAVANGVVYVGARDSKLHAVDLRNGAQRWTYSAGGWVDSSPEVINGKVYFTSRDGTMLGLNADGSLYRKVTTGGTNVSSVAADRGLLFFGSGFPNRDVFAVRESDGAVQWRFKTGQMVYSSPVVDGGTVYVGSDDGKYYALDSRSGDLKWSFATKGNIYRASPAVDQGVVFGVGGGKDSNIYAMDARSGAELGRFNIGGGYVSTPVVDDLVYVQAADPARASVPRATRLLALSYDRGAGFRLEWEAATGFALAEGFASTPKLSGSLVYVASGDGNVYCFDADEGSKAYSDVAQVGDGFVSSPAVSGQTVVVGDRGGTVQAIKQSAQRDDRQSDRRGNGNRKR